MSPKLSSCHGRHGISSVVAAIGELSKDELIDASRGEETSVRLPKIPNSCTGGLMSSTDVGAANDRDPGS